MVLRLRGWRIISYLSHDLYIEELVYELSDLHDNLFDARFWHPALLYRCVGLENLSLAR